MIFKQNIKNELGKKNEENYPYVQHALTEQKHTGLYHLCLQNSNSWWLDLHSSNPHHLNGKRGKSRAYSGWKRFNILLPTCPRMTNQFAFAEGISQKYDVGKMTALQSLQKEC